MIVFKEPYYLHSLWLLPIGLLLWTILRRSRPSTEASTFRSLISRCSPYVKYAKHLLLLVAFVLMTLALARPMVNNITESPAPAGETAIIFALDVSKSMLATDVAPDRLTMAKNTIYKIAGALKGEQAGVVIFAGNANAYVPLTTDYKILNNAIRYASVNSVAKQGTALGEAINTSALLLSQKNIRVKSICIFSDGENLSGSFQAIADSVRKAGIHIFAFGAGTTEGSQLTWPAADGRAMVKKDSNGKPVISSLHEDNLLQVTGNDSANYRRLNSPQAGALTYMENLHKLQSIAKKKTIVQTDFFRVFLVSALLLLIIEMLIPYSLTKRK